MGLTWGVHGVRTQDVTSFEEMVAKAKRMALRHGVAKAGDRIVVTDPGFVSHIHQIELCGGVVDAKAVRADHHGTGTTHLLDHHALHAPHRQHECQILAECRLAVDGEHVHIRQCVDRAVALGRDPKEMSDEQLQEARERIERLGFPVEGASNEQLRQGLQAVAEGFRDGAPMTANDFVFWFEDIYGNKDIVPQPIPDVEPDPVKMTAWSPLPPTARRIVSRASSRKRVVWRPVPDDSVWVLA